MMNISPAVGINRLTARKRVVSTFSIEPAIRKRSSDAKKPEYSIPENRTPFLETAFRKIATGNSGNLIQSILHKAFTENFSVQSYRT
jgi:hypothetical protein